MRKKYALYFDLVGSRKLNSRAKYKKELSHTIESLNDIYKKDLYVPVEIIKGIDEVEVVLKSPTKLLEILFEIIYRMRPHHYRIVGVQGHIDIVSKKASQLDGPALHQIPPALDYIKKNNFYFIMQSDDPALHAILNSSLPLLCQYWYELTPTQLGIYEAMRRGLTQREYAESQNQSPQYISKVVKTIHVKQYLWVENQIHQYLKHIAL